MSRIECPDCHCVMMELRDPIVWLNQDTSAFPLETKIGCGRCGAAIVRGKGAITIDGTNGKIVVDGRRDPTKPGAPYTE